MIVNTNCKYFLGYKPCKYNILCANCNYYEKKYPKILIIKLASLGDVLRTTPLLTALKKKYPKAYIIWLTKENALPLLQNNDLINELLSFSLENILRLQVEEFDLLISLDKENSALALASLIKAKKKIGFAMNNDGKISIFNKQSEYALLLGLSNQEKFFENKKSYQQIIFEMCNLQFKNEKYILNLTSAEKEWGRSYLKNKKNIIAVNISAGNIFAGKRYKMKNVITLAKKIKNNFPNYELLFLGGEEDKNLFNTLKQKIKFKFLTTNKKLTLREFASIVNCCKLLITGDTLAMHLAIALNILVVVLFGSTVAQEIHLYNQGKKIVSQVSCSPCYLKNCPYNEICMENISVEEVFAAVKKLI